MMSQFADDGAIPAAIRMASKEAERQKKIKAVLERERVEFERLTAESSDFRKEMAEKESKKQKLDNERKALMTLVRSGSVDQKKHAEKHVAVMNEMTQSTIHQSKPAQSKPIQSKSKSKEPEHLEGPKRKKSLPDQKITSVAQKTIHGFMKWIGKDADSKKDQQEPQLSK